MFCFNQAFRRINLLVSSNSTKQVADTSFKEEQQVLWDLGEFTGKMEVDLTVN